MIKNRLYILFIILTLAITAFAQDGSRTAISGIVIDAETGETLPFVQVYFLKPTTNKGLIASEIGTTTDLNGNFAISNTVGYTVVNINMVGYKTETITLAKGQNKTKAKILLTPDVYGLDEVVITPPKSKKKGYRRRGNPAVDLIKEVIAHKNQHSTSRNSVLMTFPDTKSAIPSPLTSLQQVKRSTLPASPRVMDTPVLSRDGTFTSLE